MVPKHSAIAEVSGVTNASPSTATSAATCCWSAPAPAPTPPPPRSPATSSTSRAARPAAVLARQPRKLKPYKRAKLGAAPGRLLRAPLGVRPARRHGGDRRAHGRARVSLESIVQRRPRWALPGIDARLKPGAPTAVILITHETTEEAIRAGARRHRARRQGVRAAADDPHREARGRRPALAGKGMGPWQ